MEEEEEELSSKSIILFDDAIGGLFGPEAKEHASGAVTIQSVLPQHQTPEAAAPSSSSLPPSPQSMSHLLREKDIRIRELERVNVELLGEIDRTCRTKDQLIESLQHEVQRWRAETREKDHRVTAVQSKADQADLMQVEHSALKSQAEDLLRERDNLLVRLDKSNSDGLLARNELRSVRAELNSASLELGRLRLDNEAAANDVSSLRSQLELLSSSKKEGDGASTSLYQKLRETEEQMQIARQEASDKTAHHSRALDDLSASERRVAALETEMNLLRRKAIEVETIERELTLARRQWHALESELREVGAENAHLRSQGYRSYEYRSERDSGQGTAAVGGAAPGSMMEHSRTSSSTETAQSQSQSQSQSYPPPPPPPASSYTVGRSHGTILAAPIQIPSKTLVESLQSREPAVMLSVPSSQGKSLLNLLLEEKRDAHASTSPFVIDSTRTRSVLPSAEAGSTLRGNNIIIHEAAPAPAAPTAVSKLPKQAPWATESSSAQIIEAFEAIEKVLTGCISEKTALREEGER